MLIAPFGSSFFGYIQLAIDFHLQVMAINNTTKIFANVMQFCYNLDLFKIGVCNMWPATLNCKLT